MAKTIEDIAYDNEQLQWMKNHGISIDDMIENLDGVYQNKRKNNISVNSIKEIYHEWENDIGFNKLIWLGKEEFLNSKYQDKEYVKSLLSHNEYEEYIESMDTDRDY